MPTAVTMTSWHGIRLNRRLRDLNAYLVTWHAVMAEDDLREGEITGIEVAGKKLTLLNVGGEIRPFEDRRLHLNSPISEGDLDSYTLHYVTCAGRSAGIRCANREGYQPRQQPAECIRDPRG